MRKLARLLIALILAAVVLRGAYVQGISHAITTASVWAENGSYFVDVDGDVHEYR